MKRQYNKRLRSDNFRKVSSEAINNIDYNEQNKIMEIEFSGGKIYHYCNIDKNIWRKFLSVINDKESLGTYVNSEFKKMVEDKKLIYYELKF